MNDIQSKNNNHDPSNGWNYIASKFIERRQKSHIGIDAVKKWASDFPSGSDVLDLGCGFGVPISNVLMNQELNFQYLLIVRYRSLINTTLKI